MLSTVLLVLALLAVPGTLLAQDGTEPVIEPASRSSQIEQERADTPHPAVPDKSHPFAGSFNAIQKFTHWVPLRVSVEGLGPGAGLTLSSVIERQTHNGRMVFKLFGGGEIDGFYNAGVAAEFPSLTSHDLTFQLQAAYSNSPQLEYYGSGPNSLLQNRTDYLREDSVFSFEMTSQGQRHLRPACSVAELLLNVGPGTNGDVASTGTVFGPAQAPGIDHQSNYLIAGCALQMDWRDFPEDPHRGTYAMASYNRYSAQSINQFSFNRFSGTAEQYIPFFNETRVIALLARTDWAVHEADQIVPFYLQSTLGSDLDLRGYRRYRFSDENSVAFTAEYRTEVSTSFDFAVFGDTGQVFHSPGEWRAREMKFSEGVGVRIKGPQKNVVVRLDVGFSKEGFRVWLKFGKLL